MSDEKEKLELAVLTPQENELLSHFSEADREEYTEKALHASEEDRKGLLSKITEKVSRYLQEKKRYDKIMKKHQGVIVLPPLAPTPQWRFRHTKNAADVKRLQRNGHLTRMARNG